MKKYICKFCNKEISNAGCLVLHESYCKNNPNKKDYSKIGGFEQYNRRCKELGIPHDNQYTKAKKLGLPKPEISEETRKKLSKTSKGRKHTEETKLKLSLIRKKWLSEHKDEHVWKRDSKFRSIPCENLKSFLKDKGINFVEEYSPFNEINYSVDIAFPDEKIGIEVNGNQHYNRDGSLKEYYQKRHDYFENAGWKLFEIHYTKCYKIKINDFYDILSLPIYDKDYVQKYFSRKEEKIKNIETKKKEKIKSKQKEQKEQKEKEIILNLIINSGIDFSKSGWSTKAKQYLKERNELWNVGIFRCIRKYAPEFLEREDVWKRKGSKI